MKNRHPKKSAVIMRIKLILVEEKLFITLYLDEDFERT